jgi:hypothetical protein
VVFFLFSRKLEGNMKRAATEEENVNKTPKLSEEDLEEADAEEDAEEAEEGTDKEDTILGLLDEVGPEGMARIYEVLKRKLDEHRVAREDDAATAQVELIWKAHVTKYFPKMIFKRVKVHWKLDRKPAYHMSIDYSHEGITITYNRYEDVDKPGFFTTSFKVEKDDKLVHQEYKSE